MMAAAAYAIAYAVDEVAHFAEFAAVDVDMVCRYAVTLLMPLLLAALMPDATCLRRSAAATYYITAPCAMLLICYYAIMLLARYSDMLIDTLIHYVDISFDAITPLRRAVIFFAITPFLPPCRRYTRRFTPLRQPCYYAIIGYAYAIDAMSLSLRARAYYAGASDVADICAALYVFL